MKLDYKLECNIAQTLNLVGEKWALLIIHQIQVGKTTFKELQEALPGIPTNLLSKRLADLIEHNILTKHKYQDKPARYRYELTPAGEDLDDVVNALILWGDKHLTRSYKCISHTDCTGNVEVVYKCKTCHKVMSRSELQIHSREICESSDT